MNVDRPTEARGIEVEQCELQDEWFFNSTKVRRRVRRGKSERNGVTSPNPALPLGSAR